MSSDPKDPGQPTVDRIEMRRTAVGYGVGVHAISEDQQDALMPGEGLLAHLRETFASPEYRAPTLPTVAIELHELTRNPDVSLDRVTAVLEQDAMLAADVLRCAQSPLYATQVPLRSLDDAVRRLGLKTVRDLVWEVALRGKVFRAPGFDRPMESLRSHSVVSAHLARLVSSYTSVGSEYAFLCGLLHDVGLAASMLVLAQSPMGKKLSMAAVGPDLDRVHESAAEAVTRLWALPVDIQIVVANHHVPKVGGYCHPLAAVVCVAQQLANEYGASVDLGVPDDLDLTETPQFTFAVQQLGLAAPQLDAIRRQAEAITARLMSERPPSGS